MDKYNREKHLETVLKQLIHQHFRGLYLGWSHDIKDTIADVDKELWLQLIELMPEVINAK